MTSHHCQILFRSLAARTAGGDTPGLSAGLLRAADAAGRARVGWLHVARALNQVDTDTMRHLSPTAGEAGDLALCTGRLAYADRRGPCPAGPAISPGHRTTLPRIPATSRWRWRPPTTPATP